MSWWIWSKRTNRRGWWLTSVEVSGFLFIAILVLALLVGILVPWLVSQGKLP